jgi:CheY-like chemotaxis protein
VADQMRPHGGSSTSTESGRIDGLRVLYAEDHPGMQRAVGRLLRAAGASVTIADDGLDATERALVQSFDLILMDLRMPRMSGFEAARALRAAGCHVAFVAVTADAMPNVRANALTAGFDAVLAKPFELSDLLATIAQLSERHSALRQGSDAA